MAARIIAAGTVGTILVLGLASTAAFGEQPEPANARSSEAARTQTRSEEPNGQGSPLAVSGQEVGQQSRRQLGPGDGSGNQGSGRADGSGNGSPARSTQGSGAGATAAAQGDRGSRGSGTSAKRSAKRSERSPAASLERKRLRDPGTGCTGAQGMSRQGASSGQRRGGGGR